MLIRKLTASLRLLVDYECKEYEKKILCLSLSGAFAKRRGGERGRGGGGGGVLCVS